MQSRGFHFCVKNIFIGEIMASLLEQLKSMTTIVADTGDIDAIRARKPVDGSSS